jgi:hypothetical protein
MSDQPKKSRLMAVLGSFIAAALFSFFLFFFFIQTPILSRREPFFAFVLFICLTPLVYLLLTRFIIIKLNQYNGAGRFSWLLLSGLIGILAVFSTIKTPLYIQLLPKHNIKIQIPGSNTERSVTLQWFTSGLGDIGFGQITKVGNWEQTPLGLSYTDTQLTALEWTGRTGDFSRMVFLASSEPTDVSITVDGNPNPVILSVSTDSATTFEANFQLSLYHQLPVWLSYWFSTSFLFLTITLFLAHVSIKLGGRSIKFLEKIDNRLNFLSEFIQINSNNKWWNRRDGLIILFFFLISMLFFLGRWNGLTPFVDLNNDAAYISSYAASLDNTQAFSNDPLFSSPGNFGYYTSLQVSLIRLLTKITGGYGLSYILLMIPYVFFQLTGFYLLGKLLYKSRFFSLLLALTTIPIIYTQAGDYWGIWYDPQPRMMFQAFVPWLLLLVFLSLTKPRLRWLVMITTGLLIYIHPVSTPAIAFSAWLGYFVIKPLGITWKQHLHNQFLYAFIFILIASPFAYQYINNRDLTSTSLLDYETARAFLERLFPSTFHIRLTFSKYILVALNYSLIPFAYFGSVLVFRHPEERQRLGLILYWLAGILFISVGLSSFEIIFESKLHHLPMFLDLIRGLRYVIPLMEILVFWPLALYWRHAQPGTRLANLRKLGIAVLAIAMTVIFSLSFPKTFQDEFPNFRFPNYRFQTLECLRNGNIVCPSQEFIDELGLIEYIRIKTNKNSPVISIPPNYLGGAVRFQALHPLAFDPNDMNRLAPGNLSSAIAMEKDVEEWSKIDLLPAEEKLEKYLEFGIRKQAEYAIVRNPIPEWLNSDIVFSNQTYSLIRLEQ